MGDEWGPMSAEELMAVARRGRLTRHDTVRRGSNGTWVRAEVVKGLFSAESPAPTATSDRSIKPRLATPAKRSLQPMRETKYWVKIRNRIDGPYSAAQLKQMAADGKLRPIHQISRDRCRWVLAMQVKGLTFGGGSPEAQTASLRSVAASEENASRTLAEIVR
jgi:hypothetical protein